MKNQIANGSETNHVHKSNKPVWNIAELKQGRRRRQREYGISSRFWNNFSIIQSEYALEITRKHRKFDIICSRRPHNCRIGHFTLYKNENCTCKACKTTSFHCEICNLVTFLAPSSSWLLKLPVMVPTTAAVVRSTILGKRSSRLLHVVRRDPRMIARAVKLKQFTWSRANIWFDILMSRKKLFYAQFYTFLVQIPSGLNSSSNSLLSYGIAPLSCVRKKTWAITRASITGYKVW